MRRRVKLARPRELPLKPDGDHSGSARAVDIGVRVVTDEHALLGTDTQSIRGTKKYLARRLRNTFLLGDQDQVDELRELQRAQLAALHLRRSVRHDRRAEAGRPAPGEHIDRSVEELTAAPGVRSKVVAERLRGPDRGELSAQRTEHRRAAGVAVRV